MKWLCTYIWPTRQNGIVLTSIQDRSHPLTMMGKFCTSIQAGTTSAHNDGIFSHFHPGWNHIRSQWWKNYVLFTQAGTTSAHNDGRLSSRLDPHPLTMMKDFLHLYLTYSSERHNPIQARTKSAHNDGRLSSRKEPYPLTMMKDLCTHIWPGRNWILHHDRMA